MFFVELQLANAVMCDAGRRQNFNRQIWRAFASLVVVMVGVAINRQVGLYDRFSFVRVLTRLWEANVERRDNVVADALSSGQPFQSIRRQSTHTACRPLAKRRNPNMSFWCALPLLDGVRPSDG